MRWLRVAILTIAPIFAIATGARADTKVEAEFKKLLAEGIDAFRLGKHADARTLLQRARAIIQQTGAKNGDPARYLAAVAQAESKWDDCIASAREALVVEPAAKSIAETRKLHAACRKSAGRAEYFGTLGENGALSVTSNVPTATVKVRGLIFGGTPVIPRSLQPGRVAIDIEKAGYITAHLTVDVLPGIVTDVDAQLQPGEEVVSVPLARKAGWVTFPLDLAYDAIVIDGAIAKVPPDRRIELAPGMHVVEIRAAGRDSWRRQIAITADTVTPLKPELVKAAPRRKRAQLGVVFATGGITLGVVGVFSYYTAKGASDDARRIAAIEIARPIGDTTEPIYTRTDFEEARSRAKRWATFSNFAYGAGMIVGGIGVYYILKGRAPVADEVPAVVVAPIEGGAMIGKVGSW